MIPIRLSQFHLIMPQIIKIEPLPETFALRLFIKTSNFTTHIGSNQEDAKEIFQAYHEAIIREDKFFDYYEYELNNRLDDF